MSITAVYTKNLTDPRWVTDGKGNERFVEVPESGEYPGPVELVPGEGVDPEPLPVA